MEFFQELCFSLVDSVGGLPHGQSLFSLLRRGPGDGIQIHFKGCDRRLNCGIRESALTFGVSPLLGLDLDSIALAERFFNRRSYCTQIRLKLLRKGALSCFVFIHAESEGNPRVVDERDVCRDGRNQRNAPQRPE
jgi:hypothetical protein